MKAQLSQIQSEFVDAKVQVEAKEQARKDVQTELDDLLVVFADLEAKRSHDKGRLKELGEAVSEDEGDEDPGAEGEGDPEAAHSDSG